MFRIVFRFTAASWSVSGADRHHALRLDVSIGSPICFHLKSVDVDLKYDEFITTCKCNKIITRKNAISMFYFFLTTHISYLHISLFL